MMAKNIPKMPLPKLDDLFTTEEERTNDKLEKVIDIKLSDIDDFPDHPFKVIENEDMYNMRDSIKENGVLVPALVRKKPDGRYEMVSGHRRKYASQLANNETLPCIVRDLTDDEAVIIMVDSNLQREEILPSEKAFAYKMKLEALTHQGKRTDLTCDQLGDKLNNKASTDRLELAKLLNISELQMGYITNVGAGRGLLKVGSSLVPFVNKFPTNTKLYKLMTTKPGEGN